MLVRYLSIFASAARQHEGADIASFYYVKG